MIFTESPLPGAFVIDIEPHRDERGFFARSYCADEFRAHSIELPVAQCNVSFNSRRGTLRGMHFQATPEGEAKLVRCTRGVICDVLVDIRPGSPTFSRHVVVELSALNWRAVYIPAGFAHGFQTLEDDSEVFYQMSAMFSPGEARGLRWNDPALGINWPLSPTVISAKDASYADFAG